MRWFPPAVLALALMVIAPVLYSGWLADDAFYSALPGILGADRLTLWQAMAHAFGIWFFGNGRFYPGLILEKYAVFDLFTNVAAYKLFLIAATLLTLEMFRRCVQAYTARAFALLCTLTAAALLLVHGYQDAVIAYNAMPQAVAIAMLASFMAFRAALLKQSRVMAAIAIGLYALAALIYEDAYVLCALYPLLARSLSVSRRAALRSAAPYVVIAAALALFELALRAAAKLPPDALYAVNADPAAFLKTLFYQTVAAVPLAYWLADPLRSFPAAAVAVFAGFAAIAWIALRAVERSAPKSLPIGIGILAAVLPAIPIALLVKYQYELRLGTGYLPVFLQTFGVALLLASAATAAVRARFGIAAKAAATIAFAALGACAFASNVQLVGAQEAAQSARALFQQNLASGLASHVPDGSTITIPKIFDWIDYDDSGPDGISTRGLLYQYGGKRADLEAPGDARARFALEFSAGAKRKWSIHTVEKTVTTKVPGGCNNGAITNGDFTFGFRCWAQVATARGRLSAFPQFRIEAASIAACFPSSAAGNPYAAIDVPAGAAGYIAQTFRYRSTPTRMRLRVWGAVDPATVQVGIVFPVGTGIGTERILDTFVVPALQRSSGACSGLSPVEKTYVIFGYARGSQIQVRLHAASFGTNGAIAAFDDVTSSP